MMRRMQNFLRVRIKKVIDALRSYLYNPSSFRGERIGGGDAV